MNFYNDIFLPLCASVGKKPTNVAKELGFARSLVSNWKNRGSTPNDLTMMRLSEYFGVDISVLKGEKKQPAEDGGLSEPKLSEVKTMLSDMIPLMSEDTASMLLILAKQLKAKDTSTGSLR